MLRVLLLQPLLQELEKLLHGLVREAEVPQLLDGALEVLGGVLQPLHHLIRQVPLERDVLEELQEHLVEAVELHLALHHNWPRQR